MKTFKLHRNIGVHGSLIAALLATSMLGACQTNRYGSDYSNDVCRAERDSLQETGNYFAQDMIAGALKGAIGGALVGGLTAAVTGGNVGKAVAVGAVAGGVTGFGAGYFNALAKQQGQTPTGLFAVFQGDMEKDNAQIDKTRQAFKALIDCRKKEIASVKSGVANGSISKADGNVKMAEIRQKIGEDRRVGAEILKNLDDRTAQYAVAGAKLGVPGAKAKAQAAYTQKVNAGGGSVEQPDLSVTVSAKDRSSPEAKKAAASFTSMNAGVSNLKKDMEVASKLGEGRSDGFGWLPFQKWDAAAISYRLPG